ncbi:adenine deaminase [Marinisporobacter balticus]|uniref:Adenine deaminase n=1 Tax=Marinisporobacter balticus TaxID=2018667 RepID=A0A4R2KP11_9FIRM|nr:adenine deaminase [Marinisporobacter balticus]TCO75254.1 adenine deaminase [Marinisporobacter balticus]
MKDIIKLRIDIAAGRKKASLVLKNCNIVNVFTDEIIYGDIAIEKDTIIGIGIYEGKEEIDMYEAYVAPGLIDGHLHIESSMLTPSEFSRAILPRGTTTIIADPHEIANVCGLAGIEYMIDESEKLPLSVYIMLPSCVPATSFENSGAVLNAKKLKTLVDHPRVLGLGELMDYPAVINGDEKILDKIHIVKDKLIDGHGPVISDKALNAYVVAGTKTEHECSTVEEMINRLRLGMYVQIREGSAARNLEVLLRGVTKENLRRCIFCTDDRHPEDILMHGHIDNNIREAIKGGLNPISAIKMATLNASECYGLKNVGAVAPGYKADLIVVDDLKKFNVKTVFKEGKCVAQNGKALFHVDKHLNPSVLNTMHMDKVDLEKLRVNVQTDIANVIKIFPHSLTTEKVVRKIQTENGAFKFHKQLDILKMAVIERHNKTGNIGLALVEDFKLKNGAIASTVAHDSHNLVVIGDSDEDMLLAINEIEKCGGGITICSSGKVLKTLSLPVGGLMSDMTIEEVHMNLKEMIEIAYGLGVNKEIDPFMTLSFLALPVIPQIKLTDMGLFDVTKFDFIELSVKE